MKTEKTRFNKPSSEGRIEKSFTYAKPMLETFTSQVNSRCFEGSAATNNAAKTTNCINGPAVTGTLVCAPGAGNDTIEGYCEQGGNAYSITTCYPLGTGATPGQNPCNGGLAVAQ